MTENQNQKQKKESDIYQRTKKLESAIKYLADFKISATKKKQIEEFVEYKAGGDAPSILRQVKYYRSLPRLLTTLPEKLETTQSSDVAEVLKQLSKKNESAYTRLDRITLLKSFFKWLIEEDATKKIFRKIPNPKIRKVRVRTVDLLSWDEAVQLSRATTCLRDAAFIQCLWDGGLRLEEILTLKVGDVESVYSGRGIVLHIRRSKTEDGIRAVAIPLAAGALINYLTREHGRKDDVDAPLFCRQFVNKRGGVVEWKPLTARWGNKVLQTAAERAGIIKKVNPHAFRKASASYYSNHLNDTQLKSRYGWTADTKVLRRYISRNEEQTNVEVFAAAGVVDMEVKDTPFAKKPHQCLHCGETNPTGWDRCVKCGATLEPSKMVREMEEIKALNDTWRLAKNKFRGEADTIIDLICNLVEKVERLEDNTPVKIKLPD